MFGLVQQSAYDLVSVMLLVQLGLGVIITALAALGYRNNRSRPMLFLATGMAFLTFIQSGISITLSQTAPPHLISVGTQISEIVGLLCILYSIVLARNL